MTTLTPSLSSDGSTESTPEEMIQFMDAEIARIQGSPFWQDLSAKTKQEIEEARTQLAKKLENTQGAMAESTTSDALTAADEPHETAAQMLIRYHANTLVPSGYDLPPQAKVQRQRALGRMKILISEMTDADFDIALKGNILGLSNLLAAEVQEAGSLLSMAGDDAVRAHDSALNGVSKVSKALAGVMEARQRHRYADKIYSGNVKVNSVDVYSGGQAVVGDIHVLPAPQAERGCN